MAGKSDAFFAIAGLTRRFDAFTAVREVALEIHEGEFFTLVGPPGSGKTTMIRLLAGMDRPTDGTIRLRGELLNQVPTNKRPTCTVSQNLALFPHRSVGENIEFPLKIAGIRRAVRRERVSALLEQLHLPVESYDQHVNQCSDNERRRIAFARALAFDPQVLFVDEPLSALDVHSRRALEKELKDIHRETGKTFFYTTHSPEEAMVMSDRIGVMQDGALVQVGTPGAIYSRPINRFIAEFMGEINILEVEADGPDTVRDVRGGSAFQVRRMPENFTDGFLIIRPENIKIGAGAAESANRLAGRLFDGYTLGSRIRYQIRSRNGAHWLVERLQDNPLASGQDAVIVLGWDPEDAILVRD